MRKPVILFLMVALLIVGGSIAVLSQGTTNAGQPDNTLSANVPPPHKGSPENTEVSFAEDVQPLLNWRCVSCHKPGGMGYEKSGLDLTSYQNMIKGTKFGPVIVPGDPVSSSLMALVDWHVDKAIRMPYGKKQLSSCDRDVIRTWIRQGAKDN